ncbi:MAG: hypothetical protein M3R35_00905 [Candidatus Eremiobacteraeota bacterium]|nr:hypothetical protein [Candidatus Eremiobacteraeota bacterium]
MGLHLDEGFCVRFPVNAEEEPLETWEDWSEIEFLGPAGTIENAEPVSEAVLNEAREVLSDADDGCHLHLHEGDE